MGHSQAQQLHYFQPPIGVLPNLISREPTVLTLKEKLYSWSGDDFKILDGAGNVALICSGKAFSMRQKKVIMDGAGTPILQMRNKLASFLKTIIIEDMRGNELARVEQKWSLKSKIVTTFHNFSSGQPAKLILDGDFWGMNAGIMFETGQAAAQINRQWRKMRDWLGGAQTYGVCTAAGVDIALIAAMCIAFDQFNTEE